jgi:hypothetical protein
MADRPHGLLLCVVQAEEDRRWVLAKQAFQAKQEEVMKNVSRTLPPRPFAALLYCRMPFGVHPAGALGLCSQVDDLHQIFNSAAVSWTPCAATFLAGGGL